MTTKFDARQTISRDTLAQIVNTTGKELDDILRAINSELTPPLTMTENSPADRIVNIGAISLSNPETGRQKSITPISNTIPVFTSGTVTLDATGAGNAVPSVGSNLALGMSANEFLKVGIALNSSGNLVLNAGTAGASEAAATNPPLITATHPIGYIVVETDGGNNVQNITAGDIFQYTTDGGDQGTLSLTDEHIFIGNAANAAAQVDTNVAVSDTANHILADETNGLTIKTDAIRLTSQFAAGAEATSIARGVVSTGTQSFTGSKTFLSTQVTLQNVAGNASFQALSSSEARLFLNSDTGGTAREWGITVDSTDGNLEVRENGSSSSPRMVWQEGGNVGLNLVNPTSQFHIKSDAAGVITSGLLFEATASSNALVRIYQESDAVGDRGRLEVFFDGGVPVIGLDAGGTSFINTGFDFNVDDGTLFVDASTNRVGVGDSTPAARFTLKSSASTGVVNGFLFEANGSTNKLIRMYEESSERGRLEIYDSDVLNIVFDAGATSYINNGSNFGIGTNSPSAGLHLGSDFAVPVDTFTTVTGNAINVNGLVYLKFNMSGAQTINNFTGGSEGQIIHMTQIGGSTTTIADSAGGDGEIKNHSGGNIAMSAQQGLSFIYSSGDWHSLNI